MTHLFIASAAELRHHAKPVFVLQFFLCHSLDHVQQLFGDQALELTEGLPLEDRAYVRFFFRLALMEDQFADFAEQGRGLLCQHPL
jgi:hypothetical protein